ncbi:hypothetical protein FACS1894162_4030 [Bacteroidia bacterium]|nr:hypothetical protein FACS1894162_4030 [Bacteroidia bacterium]
MKRLLYILFILCFSLPSFAQKQVRKDLRSGNKEYNKENYTDAEVDYRRAIEANAHSIEGAYNLGNALYKQGKGNEALEQYQVVVGNEKDKSKLAMTYHNAGNVFMATAQQTKKENKDYSDPLKKSIEAYKNSLKNDPTDDETRYNLALAQKLLKDLENQQQNQGKNKDQNQDQQDQQQDKQNQDKKEQDKKEDQQQQNPNQMSKENADQILDAMMQEEKNTQEKVKAEQMQQQKRRKTNKNW